MVLRGGDAFVSDGDGGILNTISKSLLRHCRMRHADTQLCHKHSHSSLPNNSSTLRAVQ